MNATNAKNALTLQTQSCPTCNGTGEVQDYKHLRTEAGIFITDCAKEMGIGKAHLSLMENHQRRFTPDMFEKYLQAIERLRR